LKGISDKHIGLVGSLFDTQQQSGDCFTL